MQDTQERRKFARLNVLVDIIYTKRQQAEDKKLSLAKNISGGGICLIAYEELKESEILDLKIVLPKEKEPVKAVGRVAWAKEFIIGDASSGRRLDVGVEFLEIKDEDVNKIHQYLLTIPR